MLLRFFGEKLKPLFMTDRNRSVATGKALL
jgi:hypothetical protein